MLTAQPDDDNDVTHLKYIKTLIYSHHIHHHHHHQVALLAHISMTLLRHSSLSDIALGRSSAWHSGASMRSGPQEHAYELILPSPAISVIREFFPGRGHISTTVWEYHMDINQTLRE